jgi:hypothetical protein
LRLALIVCGIEVMEWFLLSTASMRIANSSDVRAVGVTCRALQMLLIACVWLITACASPQQPPARSAGPFPRAPEPAPNADAPSPGAETGTAPAAREISPGLQRLVRSVRALEDSAEDAAHHRLTRSLRDAAAALDELEPDRAGGHAALRTAAERIDASGIDSLSHADDLRAALVAARDRLRMHEPAAQRAKALEAALAELGRGVDRLNASRPLLEQQRVAGDCLRALVDAVFLTAGHDAPFAGREAEPRSVADVMEQAREDVLALARADLSNIRELTSRAMYSMAELVEAVVGRDIVARQSAEIRAEARRLEQDSSGPFARAGWVERGLRAALGTVDQLELCREALVAGWTEAARRAAEALPERGALPFQHAAIQDAFRATLDALGVAVLDGDACQPSSRRPPRVSIEADERVPAR